VNLMLKTPLTLVLVCAIAIAPFAAAAQPSERRVEDGTKLSVRLMEALSSGTAEAGQSVTFEVLDDVLLDGQVVIRQGTPVKGVIQEAVAKRRMGRAGKLSYSVTETRTVDRQVIHLRAAQQKSGGSNVTGVAVTTAAIAVFVPVAAPFALLRKGKDITIPSGTRIDVFVDGDHVLTPAEAVTTAASTAPAAPITNADVIKLHKAGFADDLIIAKIGGTAPNFSLEPDALVELKNAGISQRVITAMLQPKPIKE
jgi:hypothetical protein